MRSSLRRDSFFLFPLLAGLVILGCDRQPHQPQRAGTEVEVTDLQADHGVKAVASATAEYRVVNSTAARNHGLQVGERVGILSVTDDGSSLVVEGSASGLDPAGVYVSLFYDKASSPQGPRACEPGRNVGTGTDHPLSLTLGQMEIGSGGSLDLWNVDMNGDATLGPTSTLEYVPVDMIGTVSIRDARVNAGFGPQAVVACGKVTHDPAR